MAYCKHCGMESSVAAKCEWCGRDLAVANAAPAPATPPIVDNTPQARLARLDEEERQGRRSFYSLSAILLVVAAGMIVWRCSIYPWVILGSIFAVGHLLTRFSVIEGWSDDLLMVAFIFLIPVPSFFVLVGLIAYGLIHKDLNYTMIWLLGSCIAVDTLLSVVTVASWPRTASASMVLPMLVGLDKLGFLAAVLGWRSASTG